MFINFRHIVVVFLLVFSGSLYSAQFESIKTDFQKTAEKLLTEYSPNDFKKNFSQDYQKLNDLFEQAKEIVLKNQGNKKAIQIDSPPFVKLSNQLGFLQIFEPVIAQSADAASCADAQAANEGSKKLDLIYSAKIKNRLKQICKK